MADSSSRDVLSIGAQGQFSYVAGEGKVRPLVGPLIGVDFADLFELGAQAGLFCFAASSFSTDPTLFATYGIGSTTVQTVNTGLQNVEVSADLSGFTVGLRLALSGWIGGERTPNDTGPERDLDVPSYAPPGDPGWSPRTPNYAPPSQQQQPYPPPPYQPPPGYPTQPGYSPQPGHQPPPGTAPTGASPQSTPPTQAFPAR